MCTAGSVSGTEGYEDEAQALISQYESLAFTDVHRHVLHLLPPLPSQVLDIGAGTGRDAAALAEMGHHVTAVEPTAALREAAAGLHPSSGIEWLDSALPDLSALAGREGRYSLTLITAVWMHLDESQRRHAMPRVAEFLQPAGVMIFSLRHGPVPRGRRMFEVGMEETINLAAAVGCCCIFQQEGRGGGLERPGVYWSRLAFLKS
jgi:protein-L-isoaspartate O-methyltransferase